MTSGKGPSNDGKSPEKAIVLEDEEEAVAKLDLKTEIISIVDTQLTALLQNEKICFDNNQKNFGKAKVTSEFKLQALQGTIIRLEQEANTLADKLATPSRFIASPKSMTSSVASVRIPRQSTLRFAPPSSSSSTRGPFQSLSQNQHSKPQAPAQPPIDRPSQSFSFFFRLPVEVRDTIWCLLPTPRVLKLLGKANREGVYSTARVPLLLHTCIDSRLAMLRIYSLPFEYPDGFFRKTKPSPPCVYFNLALDYIYLQCAHCSTNSQCYGKAEKRCGFRILLQCDKKKVVKRIIYETSFDDPALFTQIYYGDHVTEARLISSNHGMIGTEAIPADFVDLTDPFDWQAGKSIEERLRRWTEANHELHCSILDSDDSDSDQPKLVFPTYIKFSRVKFVLCS